MPCLLLLGFFVSLFSHNSFVLTMGPISFCFCLFSLVKVTLNIYIIRKIPFAWFVLERLHQLDYVDVCMPFSLCSSWNIFVYIEWFAISFFWICLKRLLIKNSTFFIMTAGKNSFYKFQAMCHRFQKLNSVSKIYVKQEIKNLLFKITFVSFQILWFQLFVFFFKEIIWKMLVKHWKCC